MPLLLRALALVARAGLTVVADLVGPRGCVACDGPLAQAAVFCGGGGVGLEASRPDGGRSLAPFAFGGPLREAIHRLKYGDRPDLAAPLSELLRAHVRREPGFSDVELVVPVPLHPSRLASRGYNQAALLARGVARELARPCCTGALLRVRSTSAQATLDQAERRENVRSAFSVVDASAIRGKSIVVVDDVITTGATLEACAGTLALSGARAVRGLALARAGRVSDPDRDRPRSSRGSER